jgi:hypothetical protein
MKSSTNLTLALVLAFVSAAAGCAGSGTGDDVVGDDVGDDMPPGDDDVDEPTSPVGTYQVQSEFDMATGLPGTVGTIVNGFIDATDGADDPGRWLCDLAADQLDGTWGDIAHGACSLAGGYINDRLLEIAPDFVDTLIALGNDFGQIARNFGLRSQLEVTGSGTSFMSTHTTTGINFKLDNVDHVFALTAYGMENIVAPNVAVTYDTTGVLTIAGHEIPLAYGSVLRIGLDELIIPALDPFADGLGELLANQVDCYQVGIALQDAIGFGSVSMYEDACESGLEAGANLVYSQLANLDSTAFKFGISGGEARATDTNGDRKVDEITRGEWTGNLDVAGSQAPLTDAKFTGSRM